VSPGSVNRENPGFAGMRGSRGETSKDPGVPPVGREQGAAGRLVPVGAPTLTSRDFGARAVKRGVASGPLPAHVLGSETASTRRVTNTKRALLKRLGLRMGELTWAGREVLSLYAATLAKLQIIDAWLASHEPIDEDGRPAAVLALHATFSNTATRQLGLLREVVGQMGRADDELRRHLLDTYGDGK
jgi:hypothetical protein